MQWETHNFKPSSKEGCGQQCIWAKGAVSPGASCLFPGDGRHDFPGQALCSRGDALCVYHGPGSPCSLCCAWPHWSILSQWHGWAVSRWKQVWPCLRGDWGPGREFLHHARQHSKRVSPGARSHLAQQLSAEIPVRLMWMAWAHSSAITYLLGLSSMAERAFVGDVNLKTLSSVAWCNELISKPSLPYNVHWQLLPAWKQWAQFVNLCAKKNFQKFIQELLLHKGMQCLNHYFLVFHLQFDTFKPKEGGTCCGDIKGK